MSNELIAKEGMTGLRPENMTELLKLAEIMAGSQLAPKDYRGKSGDTVIAMLMGLEIGLNPMQSLQSIAVINGRPSIYGDAMLALVQNHPSFGSIQEAYDETTSTATCTVIRKGGQPHTVTFSDQDAQKAGLFGKQGPWTQYPKRMKQMRARGFALRDQFADALLGLISREEAQDMPNEIDITPAKPAPAALPAIYSAEDFDKNLPGWGKAIKAGKKTHEEIISMVSTRGALTDDQKKVIRSIQIDPPVEQTA